MTSQQVADRHGKSMGEILIVIVFFALLMVTFIFYFFKNQTQLTRTGFESVSYVFSARVNSIRGQWFMDAKPEYVMIENSMMSNIGENNPNNTGGHESKIMVPVNNLGWVDVKKSPRQCQDIWQFVMESPLIYMNEPIAVVLVEAHGKQIQHYCQYSLPSGEYFTYQTDNGKVSFKVNV